ncbi:MAG: hypothetical protein D8M57_12270 [Candidatus Scalindua sp. AMX11]|nr:MAG: hypothetical protein DWQ00_08990 [Candidatus Scalindua sp.]NOG84413.1 hypothetical protein [Planctomycetota bacterium]RZV72470.1 MAG: hypothetical protein EX341_14220 [Candidatus Scalindua sp. SCAELEC01]TDE64625.1 MAG: hypothetical protein D8M57_12270 [Candidatus Scalindua sp. AMX11]GJQ59722.1 MAG: hypothetical protein SCALA701_25230 [Candidatus Scalindua sp.]
MTSKKRYKKQISSLKEVIKDHREKIEQENLKDSPNIDRIRHWEKEIDIYEDSVNKAKKRFERG